MPVWNDPAGLLRSVPTVFNQTWQGEVRLLIVDDGSAEETRNVIESLSRIYSPIDVVRNPRNLGRPKARNLVLAHAEDEYLAWLDAGDLWHPRKLELQFEALAAAKATWDGPVLCTAPFRWVFADRDQEQVKVPRVSGDQLRNALAGSLHPYLWALLGPASAFRSAGGFDERLPRRQDFEFFVRFIEKGGRIVSTSSNRPLCTYMKTDVGRSAGEIAAANQVIRRLHAPLYARYGRRFARWCRSRQLLLVARFHEHNKSRPRSLLYKAAAWVYTPSPPSLERARRRVSRTVTGLARGLVRFAARRLRRFLPALERSGVTYMAQKVGVVRIARSMGMMPVVLRELERPPLRADDDDTTLRELERLAESDAGTEDSAPWIRVVKAYLARDRLASAQASAERGLDRHPADAELRILLLEILALRERWRDCADQWESLTPDHLEQARAITYRRVAHSYIRLGDPAKAREVAEKGALLWPHHERLLDELYTSRALTTDWRRALRGSHQLGPDPTTDNPGCVTSLGFLIGGTGPIRGEVATPTEADEVSLLLNGRPIAATSVAVAEGGSGEFSLNCAELRQFLGDGDALAVHRGDQPLLIEGYGIACVAHPGYESRAQELERRLDAGYVFDNLGRLREGTSGDVKRATLELFDAVAGVIRKSHDYTLHPFYGNLLGAVRENDILSHDAGGFDAGYVSRHHSPHEVRAEFTEVCKTLIDSGYHVKLTPWSAYIRPRHRGSLFVDVNYGWFTVDGQLNLSYGWRYRPASDPDLFHFPRESPIGSHWVPVPGNAEAVLEQVYGPNWVIPDQGFAPEVRLQRAIDFLLSESEMRAIRDHNPDLVEIATVSDMET